MPGQARPPPPPRRAPPAYRVPSHHSNVSGGSTAPAKLAATRAGCAVPGHGVHEKLPPGTTYALGGRLFAPGAKASTPSAAAPLFVFLHVPKCAGAAFFALLNRTARAQLAAGWHGSWALYPSSFYSHNAPGCLATHPWGGTHCGFAETEACLAQGYARGAGGVPMSPHTPRLYMTVLREPVEVRPRRALRPHPPDGRAFA